MVSADFNGDGILDLVTANNDTHKAATVYLGRGDGTFQAALNLDLTGVNQGPSHPTSVAAGDFNGDGVADVAIEWQDSNGLANVSFFPGNGDGSFSKATNIELSGTQTALITDASIFHDLAAGDFNGDGVTDLLASDRGTKTVNLLSLSVDGSIDATKTPLAVDGPTSILSFDVNGDGLLDLVTGNSSDLNLTVYFGNGTGSFSKVSTAASGVFAVSSMVAGDFNGDGIPDLALTDPSLGAVTVLTGNGKGVFTKSLNASTGAGSVAVATGDFNGDGIPDLATANLGANTASVLLTQATQTASGSTTGVAPVGIGPHPVEAQYTGDSNYAGSMSGTVPLYGPQAIGTTVMLTVPSTKSVYGSATTLMATLSPSSYQAYSTDGEVITFLNNGVKLGTAVLTGGVAKLALPTLPAGKDSLTAAYGGDSIFGNSVSTAQSVLVAPAGTVTSLTAVKSNSTYTLTASVTSGGAPVYPGVVNLYDGSVLASTAQLVSVSNGASPQGTAVFNYPTFVSGANSLTARFVPTAQYAGSISPAVVVTVVTGSMVSVQLGWNKTINVPDPPAPVTSATVVRKLQTAAASPAVSTYTYTFTGTVSMAGSVPYSGSVSFVDGSNNNTVVATASVSGGTVQLTSANATSPNVGKNPDAVAIGDFNQDGFPDLAVANRADNRVTILLGKGDGTFTQQAATSTGSGPYSVTVSDFNGDGYIDLAVANANDNTVTILLGKGGGTFTPGVVAATGAQPYSVVSGDFNGDGNADLAVANSGSNTVTLLFGKGDGTFSAGGTLPTGNKPSSIVAADLNGDGIMDLATANGADGRVTILLGIGAGAFTPGSSVGAGTGPVSLTTGDFNKNGFADLAAVSSIDGTVTVLLGNGTGTFKPGTSVSTGSAGASITTGDFNQDGNVDLVVANSGGNLATILLGKGDGTFTTGATAPTGTTPGELTVGDFNNDGVADVASTNLASNTVTISLTKLIATSVGVATGVSIAGTGNHNITAQVPGATASQSTTSAPVSLTASPLTTTLGLGSTASSSNFGQTVTLAATLSPATAQNHTANGETITFYKNGISVGTAPLSGGVASLQLSSLAVASYSFTAAYGGDTNFASSTTPAFPYQVTNTTPVITFSVPNLTYGQSLKLGATSTSPGAITYSVKSGPATISAGVVTATGIGQVTLTASQAAATGYNAASQQATFTATQATSSTALTAFLVKSGYGSAAALMTTISPQYSGTPTGTVTFFDGSTKLVAVSLSGGKAAYTTAQLAGGQHSFAAVYSSDTDFSASTSSSVSMTVPVTCVGFQMLSTTLVLPASADLYRQDSGDREERSDWHNHDL